MGVRVEAEILVRELGEVDFDAELVTDGEEQIGEFDGLPRVGGEFLVEALAPSIASRCNTIQGNVEDLACCRGLLRKGSQ